RPSDLHIRCAPAPPLFDGDITVAHASADRNVAVAVHAVLAAQRADTVFPAYPLSTRRQRKGRRTRHSNRDGKNLGDPHSGSPSIFVLPQAQRDFNGTVPKFRPRLARALKKAPAAPRSNAGGSWKLPGCP